MNSYILLRMQVERDYFNFIKDIEYGILRAQFSVQNKYLKKFAQHLFF